MSFSFNSESDSEKYLQLHWGQNVTIFLGLPYCVKYGKLFIEYVTILHNTIMYKYGNVTIL